MNSKFKRICSMTAAIALTASVFGIYPQVNDQIAAAATRYEFEDAAFTGTIKTEKDSAASGGAVAYMTEDGDITVTVNADAEGMYDVYIAAEGVGGGKQQSLYVNGTSAGNISIAEGTGKYTPFIATTVKLKKGENTIKISKSWGWTKFDYLEIAPKTYETVSGNASLSNPNATKETQSLMNYFASVYGEHTISGQQEIYNYGPHGLEQEFEYIKETTGDYPAIRGFDYGNFCNSCFGGDDGTTDRVIDWVKNKGGIATSSFHLNVPNDMKSYKLGDKVDWAQTTYNATDSDFVASNAYKEGTKEYDYYRAALKTLADEFNKLQEEGIPVIWRPLHEAEGGGGETGSWFWWGKEGSAVYKKLWIYTYETLTNDFGCNNLIWEWNGYDYATSGDWYPGDEYVDIVGYDKYSCTKYLAENNWEPSVEHDDTAAGSTFWSLVNLTDKTKMVAMAECDCLSTLDNLQTEHAYWLYFCPWYDGGSDNINFLSNPVFNDPDDLKEIYTSDYCITLSELPADLYTNGKAPEATASPSKKPTSSPSEKPSETPSAKPSDTPSAAPSSTPSKDGRYEFEDAELTGTVKTEKDSAASGGAVAYMTEDGTITVTVNADAEGMYDIYMAAEGVGGGKQQGISVNGVSAGNISIEEGTGKYASFKASTVKLKKGENTIKITKSWGWTKFDYLEIKAAEKTKVDATGAVLSNKNASAAAKSLYSYICKEYGNSIISGQQESTWMGSPDYEMNYIKDASGKLPAMRGLDYMGDDFDGVNKRAIEWFEKGGIVTICWHCGSDFADNYDDCKADDLDWDKALTPGTAEYKALSEAMDKGAKALKELQDAGVPVIWRPFHEFDGGWFWWGKGGADNFKKLWTMMYEKYTEEWGLDNLIWCLGFTESVPADWYPGDEYVDIIGADTYVESDGSLIGMYNKVVELAGTDVPVILHENGTIPNPENLESEGAYWSSFMTWHTEWITDSKWNTKESIKAVYNSDYVITLDELPEDLYTASASDGPSSNTGSVKTGDITLDGKIDITDLSYLSLYLIGDRKLDGDALKAADTDHDGKVLLADLATLRQFLSKIIKSLD